jgi:DNA-binding transcriptional MerR regulator
MPLRQASFNFDFNPEPEKPAMPAEKAAHTVEPTITVVDETIREVPEAVSQPVVVAAKPLRKKSTRGRMKISDMEASVAQIEVPADEILFQKSYYSIGEVSAMFHVNPSLLRFWEKAFDIFKLKKNGKGDRFYRPEDIQNVQLIHHLLRERKYTIEGARDFLKKSKNAERKFELINSLKTLKTFLTELKANI